MSSNFIVIIRGANTGHIYAIINPDSDEELDSDWYKDPTHVGIESVQLFKVPRDKLDSCISIDDLQKYIASLTVA